MRLAEVEPFVARSHERGAMVSGVKDACGAVSRWLAAILDPRAPWRRGICGWDSGSLDQPPGLVAETAARITDLHHPEGAQDLLR